MRAKPVVFIDDDIEDLTLMQEMASRLYYPTPVMTFTTPHAALDFLMEAKTEPLFILSDVNMPKLNGFELRGLLLNMDNPIKNIPFILLSTSKTDREVRLAEELKVKGFYKKATSLEGMKKTLENIMSLLSHPGME